MSVTSDIKRYAPASHEFMLLFDLNFPKKMYPDHHDISKQLS
ncbi:MAG: hypothetical protein R2812_03000 [Gelidibacter sp.]